MKTKLRFLFSAILSVTLFILAYGKEDSTLSCILKVRIEPSSNKIKGEVRIKHPPTTRFYLNDDLEIKQVTADGHLVSYHRERSPYSGGRELVVTDVNSCGELAVTYEGQLRGVINGVNQIRPDLVELALYAGWYPRFEGNELFDFELDVDVPGGFVTTSNGMLEAQAESNGRNLTRWSSFKPGDDIVLLASPLLQKVEEDQNGTKVEIFFNKMPKEYIEAKKEKLLVGMKQLTAFYGPRRVEGILRFVYSPRGGWGYSRIPFFVVSEEYALGQLKEEFGRERDFHGDAHEMSHFWWMIANMNTPDDWINEGLAEFSAFRLSERYFGKGFAEVLIKEYKEDAAQSKTETAIAETESSSDDRYVNRYEKTTLLFIEARRRFGEEKLDGVLKALHSRFAGTRNATTGSFLEEVEKQLGPEAKDFFSEALYRKKWTDEKVQLSD